MALHRYMAAAPGEKPHEVMIEADDSAEALRKLRGRHLTPVKYLGEHSAGQSKKIVLFRRNHIDTYVFTRQLTPLLNSYIPLEKALAIIAESSSEGEQRDFVNSLRQGLHEGKKFSELVRSHGSLFPDYYANLIESGEETGCLPDVLTHLYSFMGESRELKSFIVSSSVYPQAILGITVLVTILLFTVFVPKFSGIFEDMGKEMPGSMVFLLGVSAFAKWAWWLIPLLLFGGWKLAEKIFGKDKIQYRKNEFLLKMPVLSGIIINLEMCKYLRTLSIMISNHVEIIKTVKIAGGIIHNPVIAEDFKSIVAKLKGGAKLSAALKDNHFIPKEMVPMLRVGEESGTVGEMLTRISSNLEAETRVQIKRLLSLFEPAVIVFLALMVLVVVASIFMAMMDMNSM